MPDRYFMIRYQHQGRRKEEGLGWASEGWTERKAALELAKLREAARLGEGPTRLAEKRQIAQAKRLAAIEAQEQEERDALTFDEFWHQTYFPQAQKDKTPGSWQREDQLYRL
ncbi:MAG: site-specific integrase, partial [Proteobacteria bacterium]|nr:site-specific integrase [Pseudomonadota bacterium]